MNQDFLLNSLSVLRQSWGLLLALLSGVTWGTLIVLAGLKRLSDGRFSDPELTALALGGWPLPALLISVLMLGLRMVLPAAWVFALALIVIAVGVRVALQILWGKISADSLVPILFFLLFVFIRLGYVAGALLPAYFDSAEHYRLILMFTDAFRDGDLTLGLGSYYHLGYHIILAGFTALTQADIARVMLIFGQIVLAAIPLPMFFFVRRATGSDGAALFGMTLAAFGWYMPAHALNWGKYPAMLSLLAIQFTVGAALLNKRWLVALSTLAAVIIHTRSAILLAIILAAWIFSRTRNRLAVWLTVTGLGAGIFLIVRDASLSRVMEPYFIWATLLVGLLAVLAIRAFPRLTFSIALASLFTLAAMFIPLPYAVAVLDRPLVEMILFLPLALLGGLGILRLPRLAVIALACLVLLNTWTSYNSFSPSTCCQLVGSDDMTALQWIRTSLPANARVGIATADLSLATFGSPIQSTGTDAGIWVAPLTARAVVPFSYATDFLLPEVMNELCSKDVQYLYVGNRGQSFNKDPIESMNLFYERIFSLPNAKIYKIKGCPN